MVALSEPSSIDHIKLKIRHLNINIGEESTAWHTNLISHMILHIPDYLDCVADIYSDTDKTLSTSNETIIHTLIFADFVISDQTIKENVGKIYTSILPHTSTKHMIRYHEYIVRTMNYLSKVGEINRMYYLLASMLEYYIKINVSDTNIINSVLMKLSSPVDIIGLSIIYRKCIQHKLKSIREIVEFKQRDRKLEKIVNIYRQMIAEKLPYVEHYKTFQCVNKDVLESFLESIPDQEKYIMDAVSKYIATQEHVKADIGVELYMTNLSPYRYTQLYRLYKMYIVDDIPKLNNPVHLTIMLVDGFVIDSNSAYRFVEFEPLFSSCVDNSVDNVPPVIASLRIIFGYTILLEYGVQNKKYYAAIEDTVMHYTTITFLRLCLALLDDPELSNLLYKGKYVLTKGQIDTVKKIIINSIN